MRFSKMGDKDRREYVDFLLRQYRLTDAFWFLAVEKRRPFLVTAHELSRGSEAHAAAVAECDSLFGLYRQWSKTGRWPGYGECFQVTLPDWAYDESVVETPFDSEGE